MLNNIKTFIGSESGQNLMNLIGGGTGLLGGALGIAGQLSSLTDGSSGGAKLDDYLRFGVDFEPEQRKAINATHNAQQQNQTAIMNTDNIASQQRGYIDQAQAGAISQAANQGAASAAQAGLGGGVNSALLAGIRSAAPVMAAAGQGATAKAQITGDAQRARQQGIAQAGQLAKQHADIANMTNYVFDGGVGSGTGQALAGAGNTLANLMGVIADQGGAGYDFSRLFNLDGTVDRNNKVKMEGP
tara:strand:+ start:1848 stop:2579 length:732 start_codon:yes stop_codon:yes gene_type:complete